MTKKKTSTKKTSKPTNTRKVPQTHAAAKSASVLNSLGTKGISRGRENGSSLKSSMENANPVVVQGEIVDTLPDALSAGIVNEISEEILVDIRDVMARYSKLCNGTHTAADRVIVQEAINGNVYRHLTWRPGLELHVVYFDTDPIAEEQFGRILRQLIHEGE